MNSVGFSRIHSGSLSFTTLVRFRNGYSTRAGREQSPVRESRAQSPYGARRSHHAGHETNAHRHSRVPQSGQESARLPYPTLETSDDARHSTSVWATPPVAPP